MMIHVAFFVVFFSSVAANSSDVLRQCETHNDCEANHYCLYTYCERCIPCDTWFNRQPAQSLYGVPICARADDDCGVCLPGYQARDFSDQRRSMKCFPMYETVHEQPPQLKSNLRISNPYPVSIATTAMTFLFAAITIFVVRRRFRSRLNYQVKVLESCATTPFHSEENAIPLEADSFIGAEASETSIHLFQVHRNLDDPPTYEQAVSYIYHERNSKSKQIPPMECNNTNREFSAESNLSSEPMSSIALGTSTHCVKNPSVEVAHAVNRTVNTDSGFSSTIHSAAPFSEAQVNDTGVSEPEHIIRLTL